MKTETASYFFLNIQASLPHAILFLTRRISIEGIWTLTKKNFAVMKVFGDF